MKLLQVWNVTATSEEQPVSVWGRFAALKKTPKIAYRLLKYSAQLEAERNVIEKHRAECLYAAAGKEPGTDVRLEPGTPEHATFTEKLMAFLVGDSDLPPVGISMDALIDALDAEKGNVLSEADLALLEPFFTDKPKPDLKVVESA